jgi:hypothetical protein
MDDSSSEVSKRNSMRESRDRISRDPHEERTARIGGTDAGCKVTPIRVVGM